MMNLLRVGDIEAFRLCFTSWDFFSKVACMRVMSAGLGSSLCPISMSRPILARSRRCSFRPRTTRRLTLRLFARYAISYWDSNALCNWSPNRTNEFLVHYNIFGPLRYLNDKLFSFRMFWTSSSVEQPNSSTSQRSLISHWRTMSKEEGRLQWIISLVACTEAERLCALFV